MMRRKKFKQAEAVVSATPSVPGRPWWGLYRGDEILRNGTRYYASAGFEASMLILGPPRSGKTSSLVIPSVLDAPAAVVSTSTKADVLEATGLRRDALGNCFVFDPTGTVALPEFAYPLRWSPVVGCEDFEVAVAMAHALAGAARPGSALTESAHWVERAEALLAPLLFAAALRSCDMATLCRWVLARDLREPLAVLEASGHEMAQAVIAGVAQTEDRERSGIFSSASGLLAAYRSEAALATTKKPNFDPARFARSCDTVYICAPSHVQDQLAPIVVALLEQIRTAVYARPSDAAPVVFALDEVAGIAPLPSLPSLAAEGGGQRLVTLACLQDLSQARARWGSAADGFFSLFNEKIIFPGIADYQTLKLISALAGEQTVQMQSTTGVHPLAALLSSNAPRTTTTTSLTWRPRLPVDEIAQGRPGHVLSINKYAMDWYLVLPWWRSPWWWELTKRRDSVYGEVVRPDGLTTSDDTMPPDDGSALAIPAVYHGPLIMSRDPKATQCYIANGTASLVERFAPPAPLKKIRVEPSVLAPTPAPAELGHGHSASRTDELDVETADPLFDENPDHLPPGVSLEDLRVPTIRVLGRVDVEGWLVRPERAVVTELAAYLILHRDRSLSGEQLRLALRPDDEREQSAKTMRTYISMLRKALGPAYLPNAGGNGYRLAWFVTSDWEAFNQLTEPDRDLRSHLYAFEWIRGRPFEGVPSGTYGWAFSELWVSQIETGIVSAALDVSQECLESGLIDKALWVVRQALLGVPQDLALWSRRLRIAAAEGPAALVRARAEAQAILDSDVLSSLDVEESF